MNLPKTPAAWAIKLSKLLQHIQTSTEENMYPIKVQDIACDISKHFFPSEPITYIHGEDFSTQFDGMMRPVPQRNGQWGIIYNNAIKSRGRINFTLAHEFGHYLLHREKLIKGIQCGRDDMMGWDNIYGKMEAEANEFASYLLMPRNLFEEKIRGETLDLHLFQNIADYFNVSITAALLKWITFTDKRAMMVVTRDGFITWARSSDHLFKSGIFLRPKQEIIELPPKSLAARKDIFFNNESGVEHGLGVWPFKETVREMTLLADSYDMTISLLLFDDFCSFSEVNDEPIEDAYDKFQKQIKR